MIPARLDDITQIHLDALIESREAERRTIEYKRELPARLNDSSRREFLADVSSFANAGGGDLLFGIEAKEGVPTRIAPLELEPDKDLLRWEQVIREGIRPRLPGVQLRVVEASGGHVLVIRIPQSWQAPHTVVGKTQSFRFYSRTSAGKYPLDIGELRDAFLASGVLADLVREFRAERLGRVLADEGPISLDPVPKLVAHLIPFESLTRSPVYGLNAVHGSGIFRSGFENTGGHERWNIDGLLAYRLNKDENAATSYTQLFRNGILEAVDAYYLRERQHADYKAPWTGGAGLEKRILHGLPNLIETINRLDVQPPIAVLISLLGVKNYALIAGDYMRDSSGWHRFDRDTILLPDVVFDDFESVADYRNDFPTVMRPAIDALWQGGGWFRSPHYTAEGEWKPPS